MKYKLTWNTKNLKDNGFRVQDVVDYLSKTGTVDEFYGGSIIFTTIKSQEGIYQELRRVFNTEFNIKNYIEQ